MYSPARRVGMKKKHYPAAVDFLDSYCAGDTPALEGRLEKRGKLGGWKNRHFSLHERTDGKKKTGRWLIYREYEMAPIKGVLDLNKVVWKKRSIRTIELKLAGEAR